MIAAVLRRLYDWILARAAGRQAEVWLGAVSFVDGAVLPIPPELLQIPMAIARPDRTLRVAAIGTITSALGALAGYAIGALLYAALAVPLLEMTGHLVQFEGFKHDVASNPWLWLLGFCFFPSVTAIAAGSVPLGIGGAVLGSIIGRGSRFFVIGTLLKYYGPAAQRLIDRYFHLLMLGVAVAMGGFVLVRYAV